MSVERFIINGEWLLIMMADGHLPCPAEPVHRALKNTGCSRGVGVGGSGCLPSGPASVPNWMLDSINRSIDCRSHPAEVFGCSSYTPSTRDVVCDRIWGCCLFLKNLFSVLGLPSPITITADGYLRGRYGFSDFSAGAFQVVFGECGIQVTDISITALR